MQIINVAGRAALSVEGSVVDVALASDGRFGPDMQSVYEQWDHFRDWASSGHRDAGGTALDPTLVGGPSPRPPQLFAIGLNYKEHAMEAGLDLPDRPMVFTKFPSAVTGPYATIELPEGKVDWEAELVAVVGRPGRRIPESDAWSHIAGLTVGQDVSERVLQMNGPSPAQVSLGKSYPGFAPTGPALVTPDEFADPDDLRITCALNGETVQDGRTSDLIFSIPEIVAYLSRVLPLLPGDVIFTGTPSGIGAARKPPRFLTAQDVLTTRVEGIGEMRHTFVQTPGMMDPEWRG